MHMWMWFGYDLGDFLFPGLEISTRWSFGLTWIVLFFVALLFEGSKVYLAKVQREAQQKLYPYRSDERRNLLCDREQGAMEPTTSRNTSTGPVSQFASIQTKILVNVHQVLVFLVHNVVGYMLMLAVMVYNVHLLFAVVFGMMIGYFLFGAKLTLLQMQCFRTERVVICTPECDDTAETSTLPLIHPSSSTESDLYVCQTRTCIQPSHYFRASTSRASGPNDTENATCQFGAKICPSKVAKIKKLQSEQMCHTSGTGREQSPTVEDTQLLRTEDQGCCNNMSLQQELPSIEENKCCKSDSKATTTKIVSDNRVLHSQNIIEDSLKNNEDSQARENSPQITCCHATKSVPTDSQEQIIK